MKLSIIVPAHNEEDRIGDFLDAYVQYFISRYKDEVEFIFVVNNSNDRTEEILREAAQRLGHIHIIVESRNVGKGGALIQGFGKAKGDRVGFVDADGATPPDAFEELVNKVDDAGIVIGSRWLKQSIVDPPQPLSRRIASRIFNFLVRLLFGVPIHDTQCGAKVMRRESAERFIPALGLTRWAFDVDLLYQFHRAGEPILECPIAWHDVSGSRLDIGTAALDMFLAICRLRLLYSPFRWIVPLYGKTFARFVPPERMEK